MKLERVLYTTNTPGTLKLERDALETLYRRYSDWYQLKVTVTWLLRVKQFLMAKCNGRQLPNMKRALTAAEIQESELQIIRYIQWQSLGHEIRTLSSINDAQKSSKQTARNSERTEP